MKRDISQQIMKLDKDQIKHIANLARLELTSEELALYGSQLSDALNYIDHLRDIDVTGVEPTAQIGGKENIFRGDEAKDWEENEREAALKQVPKREGEQIRVKRVLE